MAKYQITAPDGSTYEVEGQGSEQEALLHFQSQWQGKRSMEHTESSLQGRPSQDSKLSDIPEGLLTGLKNVGYGAMQRYQELPIVGNQAKADWMRRALVNKRADAGLERLRQGPPSLLRSGSEVVGEAAPMTALGLAAGPSLTAAAGVGALGGYMMPSTSGAETTANATLGGLMTPLFAAGGRAVMPRLNVEPEVKAAIDAGRRKGLSFTGGQMADNPIVQRAEAHAMWNPFTKWHALPFSHKQDNEFITGLLREVGVDPKTIVKNPALDPATLNAAHNSISQRYGQVFPAGQSFDLTPSSTPGLWSALRNLRPSNVRLLPDERKVVSETGDYVRKIVYEHQGKVPATLVQDTLEVVAEAQAKLNKAGTGKAAEKLKPLYDSLLDSLPDKKAYMEVQADYARLQTVEDVLRRSKGMGEGVPMRDKLGSAIERGLPGGVIRNKSTMADLARGGERSVGVGALPDRATGLPTPSDPFNAMTYWRFNNPLAKYGLAHPGQRDMLEELTRFLPPVSSLKSAEEYKK